MWILSAARVRLITIVGMMCVQSAVLEWTERKGDLMINIIGSFVTFMGAMIFGWIGNLPMTIAMLAGVIYFKEYK